MIKVLAELFSFLEVLGDTSGGGGFQLPEASQVPWLEAYSSPKEIPRPFKASKPCIILTFLLRLCLPLTTAGKDSLLFRNHVI